MRQMSDTLAKATAYEFTTVESLEPVGASSGGPILHFTRSVTVRRPNAMFFDIKGSGDTTVDVSAHYDGRTASLRDNRSGVWTQEPVPGSLDEMLDDLAQRFSLPVPIADVVYSNPHDAFIGRNSNGGFVGRESIDGVACARLEYSDAFVDVTVWIPSTGAPLPRREELVYKQAPGAPRARIDFTSWNLEPTIADATFIFQPGAAAARVPFGQFVAGLLSGDSRPNPTSTTGLTGATTPQK